MASNDRQDDQTRSFAALTKGAIVGHYRIIEKIGAGGMGEIYLAEDTELDRKVALKFLPPHLCQDEDCRKRFKREAQAAAKLDHSNIVTVYEVGEFQRQPYFVMQHVEGQSLKEFIAETTISITNALDIAKQILQGLKAAHENSITHRDIKPSNVLIDTSGRVRIVDFGLASVSGADEITRAGSTLGTLGYMSPEQVRGEIVDHRSDLFSVGVVLYEMITGNPPFRAGNTASVLQNILNETPVPLSDTYSDAPPELQAVINKALAKAVDGRYQSCEEMSRDILRLQDVKIERDISDSRQPSIAVLPFTNLSADPEQEYFCDGISEEIINVLTQLEGIKVVARTSCFVFKDKVEDVRQIGRKLSVSHVLEGSVRKAANRIRITSQLIDVADGYHLWSEKFDRDLKDIFAIQDEISVAIADHLKGKLLERDKGTLIRRHTHNIEAYNLYLRARHEWNFRSAEHLNKAVAYLHQVVDLDPENALAYAGLADCYNVMAQAWALAPKEAFPRAKTAAMKALDLDSGLAEAKAALALTKTSFEWDFPGAEELFKQAIRLNPNYAPARHWYSMLLLDMNRLEEAMSEMEEAQKLDPLSPIARLAAGTIYVAMGRYEEARDLYKEAFDLNPHFVAAHFLQGELFEILGKHRDAFEEYMLVHKTLGLITDREKDELEKAFEQSGWKGFVAAHADQLVRKTEKSYIPATSIAKDYVRLGDNDRAFHWLEKAYENRDHYLAVLAVDPVFTKLRSDRRFASLLERIGLPTPNCGDNTGHGG